MMISMSISYFITNVDKTDVNCYESCADLYSFLDFAFSIFLSPFLCFPDDGSICCLHQMNLSDFFLSAIHKHYLTYPPCLSLESDLTIEISFVDLYSLACHKNGLILYIFCYVIYFL